MKPMCFFFHGQHGQRYSSRVSPTTTTTTTVAAAAAAVSHQYGDLSHSKPCKLNDIGYLITGMPSTAALLRGKEQGKELERNSAGAIRPYERKNLMTETLLPETFACFRVPFDPQQTFGNPLRTFGQSFASRVLKNRDFFWYSEIFLSIRGGF